MEKSEQKTICVDFDGVIAEYGSWRGKGIFGDPIRGVHEFMRKLKGEGWKIIIHTSRSETDLIKRYLEEEKIPFDYINYNPINVELGCNLGKPVADIYLDDRAITFCGNWQKAYMDINSFEIWHKRRDSCG